VYFFERIPDPSLASIGELFFHTLRLDLSTASYLVSLPLIVYVLLSWIKKIEWVPAFLKIYQPLFISFYLIVGWTNMNLYREWSVKLNYKAIMNFVQFPYEVAISGVTTSLLVPSFLYAGALFVALKINKILVSRLTFLPSSTNYFISLFVGLFLLGVNFLFIRGGWQLSPINLSMAQYSSKPIYNHLSTNTLWQLVQNTLFELQPKKSEYKYFPNDKLDAILDLPSEKDSVLSILKPTEKSPNVVLIILESFTADVVESLGGERDVAPNIEELIDDGVLFTHLYASGDRTDKGIIAILSSFPAQATKSIIKENQKQAKLPSIAQVFKQYNYNTSFYYGGESEFFGLKSYLLSHSYDQIIDKNNFEQKDFNSKWGAHDDVVLKKQLQDMNVATPPFFSTVLTLSNHEPFEIPIKPHFKGNTISDQFRNTAYYTDQSLGDYFKEARHQPWYANTLFILVADHGHRLPKNQFDIWDSRRFRIPLIFYGDVLREEYKGRKIDTYGSQTDLATTLYSQLNFNHSQSKWSNNLLRLNGNNGYAFFNWDNGFGLISNTYSLSYNEDAKKLITFQGTSKTIKVDEKLNFAKAYMQKVFSEYLSY
jgi:phosphoglycerol transferase MdoB-like AlkP superfamily enzyme